MNEKIISTLVGLSGAVTNNEKTENTDMVVMKALSLCFADCDCEEIISEIRKEKYIISPGCETCPSPCTNTSDYELRKFHENEELREIKEEMLCEAVRLIGRIAAGGKNEVPEIIYQAIAYFGCELSKEDYRKLIDKIKITEV